MDEFKLLECVSLHSALKIFDQKPQKWHPCKIH